MQDRGDNAEHNSTFFSREVQLFHCNKGVLEFFVVVDSIEVNAAALVQVRKVLRGCEVELLAHLVISTSKQLVEDVEVSLESSLEGNAGLLCFVFVCQ